MEKVKINVTINYTKMELIRFQAGEIFVVIYRISPNKLIAFFHTNGRWEGHMTSGRMKIPCEYETARNFTFKMTVTDESNVEIINHCLQHSSNGSRNKGQCALNIVTVLKLYLVAHLPLKLRASWVLNKTVMTLVVNFAISRKGNSK